MNDGIGQSAKKGTKGLLPRDTWENTAIQKKGKCGEAHNKNPNRERRAYSNTYGVITEEEMFRVNTRHRVTEDQAVSLPIQRRLAKHFAQEACDNSAKSLLELFKESAVGEFNIEECLKEIMDAEEADVFRKNNMAGLERFKANLNKMV